MLYPPVRRKPVPQRASARLWYVPGLPFAAAATGLTEQSMRGPTGGVRGAARRSRPGAAVMLGFVVLGLDPFMPVILRPLVFRGLVVAV